MNDRRRGQRSKIAERRTTAIRPGAQARSRRHIAIVVHGARAEFPGLRHLVEWMRAKGHRVRARVTWESGDGAMFAREAIEAGADTVVACGGDGMVNEVVNGLEGTDVGLGIIPAGTANDFARQVGIPDDPIDTADARWTRLASEDVRMDLSRAIQSLPEHYREVILLRDIEELTIDEISAVLALTRESVKARIHRARLMIREYLIRD